jgi:4-aminobutyrate aminotransferase-like enzyme
LANIELIENEGLVERTAEMGDYFGSQLKGLQHHRAFKEVRGMGLVRGIEFVTKADSTNEEIQTAGYHMRTICRDLGLITLTLHPGNVMFLAPPLVISRDEIDHMINIVDRAFSQYEENHL